MSKRGNSEYIEKVHKKMKTLQFSTSSYLKSLEIGDKSAYVIINQYVTD